MMMVYFCLGREGKERKGEERIRKERRGEERRGCLRCSQINSLLHIFFSENKVYSWGRGDNGSLGIPVSHMTKKNKDNVPVTSLPKPIFGSLHTVTSLSCRYWHTIIVAGETCDLPTL